MNQKIYKIIFVLLILSLYSAKVEVSFIVSILAFFLSFTSKVNRQFSLNIFFFTSLIAIGLFGIFRSDSNLFVYIKDIVYFARPIVVMLASYFLVRKIRDKEFLFTSIILLGFTYAFIHIFKLAINFNRLSTIVDIRIVGGRYNHVELVALIFILTLKKLNIRNHFSNITFNILTFLLIVSFVFYFSRVMFVVLILFIMAFKGYLVLSKKFIKTIFVGSVFLVSFIMIINQFNVDSRSKGLGEFVFKIQNTYNEIFESLDINAIKRDKRELWKHWRGYEAQSAIEQIDSNGALTWIFGKGFGSTVDLGMEVNLANKEVRYIPILHNGFVYVLFKTGIIGLIIYISYIIYLYLFYRSHSKTRNELIVNRLIVATAFYVILSSLVITGVFKPYDLSSLLIGGLFALKQYYNEDWNIRN